MIDALAASIDDASDVAGWHLESGRFFLIKSHIWNMNFVEDDAGNIPTTALAQL